jgi:hypothetical protein
MIGQHVATDAGTAQAASACSRRYPASSNFATQKTWSRSGVAKLVMSPTVLLDQRGIGSSRAWRVRHNFLRPMHNPCRFAGCAAASRSGAHQASWKPEVHPRRPGSDCTPSNASSWATHPQLRPASRKAAATKDVQRRAAHSPVVCT